MPDQSYAAPAEIVSLISEDIQQRRNDYLALMHAHGSMAPDAIIESVRETQGQLFAIFAGVSDDDAALKPAPDEWSLHELAQHAVFTEVLIAKLIHCIARSETPTAEDLEGAGIGMMPKPDGRTYRQVLDDLRDANAGLLESVRSLPPEPDREMRLPHPFFGPLTCLEWAGFQRVHDLDHIQHAQKIIAASGA